MTMPHFTPDESCSTCSNDSKRSLKREIPWTIEMEEGQSISRKKSKLDDNMDNHSQKFGLHAKDLRSEFTEWNREAMSVKSEAEAKAKSKTQFQYQSCSNHLSESLRTIHELIALYNHSYAILQAKLQALRDVKVALLRREHEIITNIEHVHNIAHLHHLQLPEFDTEMFQELKNQHKGDLLLSVQNSLKNFSFLEPHKLKALFNESVP